MNHRTIPIACFVVACLAFVVACRASSRAVGTAIGGAAGSYGGPVAAAGGAVLGSEMGDRMASILGADREYTAGEYRALLTDAHKTIAELQASKRIEVPIEKPVPFIPTWIKWAGAAAVALWLVWLKGHHLWAFFNGGGFPALKGIVAPSWFARKGSR